LIQIVLNKELQDLEHTVAQQQDYIMILQKEIKAIKSGESGANTSLIQDTPTALSLLGDTSFNYGAFNDLTPRPLLVSSKSKELGILDVRQLQLLEISPKIPAHVDLPYLEQTEAFKLLNLPSQKPKRTYANVSSETEKKLKPIHLVADKYCIIHRAAPIIETREGSCMTDPITKEIVEVVTEVVREVIVREKETKEYLTLSTMTDQKSQGTIQISPLVTLQKYNPKLTSTSTQADLVPPKSVASGTQTSTPPKPSLTLNTSSPRYTFNPSPKPSPLLSAGKVFNFNIPTTLGNPQSSISISGAGGSNSSSPSTDLQTKLEGRTQY
jgi:hypothetical protein